MKNLLLAFFLLTTGTAQSQVLITLLLGDKLNSDGLEFGLEGGINASTIGALQSNAYKTDWCLGFYFDIRVKNQWFLDTGVLVKSGLGAANLSTSDLLKIGATKHEELNDMELTGDYDQQIDYFLVPILAKYKFRNNFYLEAGPQLGLAHKSYVVFTSDISDDLEAFAREDNLDNINRIDAGFTVGTGYTLFNGNGWTFGFKYYQGLTNVYKEVSGSTNRSFFIKMNIPIGAGKKEDKKDADQG